MKHSSLGQNGPQSGRVAGNWERGGWLNWDENTTEKSWGKKRQIL